MLIMILLTIICLFIISVIVIINKKHSRTNMSNRRQLLIIIGILIIASIITTLITGYRISPLAASRANSFIKEEFVLINDLDLDWAYVHIYYDKENDKYHTTISEKKLFMYVSHFTIWHYGNSGDPIITIGSMSYNNGKGKSARLLMVDSNDKNIDSIIIKDDYKTIATKINVDNPQVILLDAFSNQNKFNVIAVDKNYKELYYYGYPKGANITKIEDYKWHDVKKVEAGQ